MNGALEQSFTIQNELGMHARAATRFVQIANRYKAEVDVEKDGQVVNGKSIMGVLMLVASQGSTITVRTREEATQFVLEVGDTGVGIPEPELPRIFDRFYRVAGVSGRTHEGSGIGLAITRRFAGEGAKVVARVAEQSKGERVLVFQYRIGGKRHRTRATHRQNYTWLQIEKIVSE